MLDRHEICARIVFICYNCNPILITIRVYIYMCVCVICIISYSRYSPHRSGGCGSCGLLCCLQLDSAAAIRLAAETGQSSFVWQLARHVPWPPLRS
jgi:hypothetical protein